MRLEVEVKNKNNSVIKDEEFLDLFRDLKVIEGVEDVASLETPSRRRRIVLAGNFDHAQAYQIICSRGYTVLNPEKQESKTV